MSKIGNITSDTINRRSSRRMDPVKRLASAVLEAAYLDLGNRKPATRAAAARFFERRHFEVWADVLGFDYGMITDGYRSVLADGLPIVDERQVRCKRQGA